jgi:hypothetical protein
VTCPVDTLYIMIQVYKEAFKARATSLRARRVAPRRKCFKGPYKRVSYAIFLLYPHYNLKIITKKVN